MPSTPGDQRGGETRYKRRRDGCQTCRSRRVKCGGEKPTCGHCQRLVLKCHWPEPVDALVEGSRSKRRRNGQLASKSTSSVLDSPVDRVTGGNQDSLQLLSQLASHPPSTFDSSTLWNHYRDVRQVSPTFLHSQVPYPPTSSDLARIHPLSDSQRGPAHDDRTKTSLHTTVTEKSAGTAIFNSTSILGAPNIDPFAFESDGSLRGSATDLQVPLLEDTFNFDLLFGLDQPVLLPSAPPTIDRNSSGTFDIPNFDSWTQDAPDSGQNAMSKHSRLCTPVTLEPSDQPILTYFLGTVTRAAITRYHNTSNYYVSLFSLSLFCPALYHGMLAWSALHMAVGMEPSEPRREELRIYATKKHALCADHLFPNLENVDFDTQGEVEALYCALMVYGQYKAVSCAAASEVRRVVNAIDGLHQRRGFVGSTSPLIQRMVSILSQYDVRSCLFGVNEPTFTLRLGSKVFEPHSSSTTGALGTVSALHLHYLDAKTSDLERQLRDARESHDVSAVRQITRVADELYERVVHLQHLFDPERLAGFGHFDWTAVIDALDQAGTKPALSQDVRHEIILACHFHGVILNVSRILNYPVSTRSVDRIIGLTLDLTIRHPEGVHGVLAIAMFLSALECRDSVKFESALKWFTLPHAAVFGTLQKSKELLLEVRQAQSEGARVDIGKMMMRPKCNFLM